MSTSGPEACPQCGTANAASQRFCGNCGSLLSVGRGSTPRVSNTNPNARTDTPSSSNFGMYIGAAAAVIVLLWAVRACERPSPSSYPLAAPTIDTNTLLGRSEDCGPGQFRITQMHGSVEYGALTVVGVVANHCNTPAGVQLQLTQYGPGDKVLDTDEQWPDSISNIAPHGTYTFKLMVNAAEGSTRFSVQPTDARRW